MPLSEAYGSSPGSCSILSHVICSASAEKNFDPYFTVMNPGEEAAAVKLTYMKGDGDTATQDISVPAGSRATVHPADVLGTGDGPSFDFATRVESTNYTGIVVERPMYFDFDGRPGGHDVVGCF